MTASGDTMDAISLSHLLVDAYQRRGDPQEGDDFLDGPARLGLSWKFHTSANLRANREDVLLPSPAGSPAAGHPTAESPEPAAAMSTAAETSS